jgi:hypothetical protein
MKDGRRVLTAARDHWCDLRDESYLVRRTGTGTPKPTTVTDDSHHELTKAIVQPRPHPVDVPSGCAAQPRSHLLIIAVAGEGLLPVCNAVSSGLFTLATVASTVGRTQFFQMLGPKTDAAS